MALFQNHAGFNLTGNRLQLVEVNYKKKNFCLENTDEEYFNEFLDISVKETKFISVLQSAYDEIILRKPLNTNNVSFSLPHEFFKVANIPYDGTLISKDLIEHFKWEMSVLFPQYGSQEYIIQYIDVSKFKDGTDRRAVVIAALRKYLKIIHKFCTRNNLVLKFIDNAHIASNAALLLDNPASRDEYFMSILLSDKNLSLILLMNNIPVLFKIKHLDTVTDVIPKLLSEIGKLKEYNIPLSSIKKFYIAGDNISDSIIHRLEKTLSVSLIKYNPFNYIEVNPDLYDNDYYSNKFNSFVSAAGIALRLI